VNLTWRIRQRDQGALPAHSASSPDELDRLFRRLILNLADLDPTRINGPVDVDELYQSLIPYRTHRVVLGIDSHEDYEMTLLRLLAGERGYAFVEPEEVRVALASEAAGVNPDTGSYRRHGSAKVTFDPDRTREVLAAVEAGPAPVAPPPLRAEPRDDTVAPWFPEPPDGTGDAEPTPGPADAEPAGRPDLPFALDDAAASRGVSPRPGSAPCAYCGGDLPVGRAVIFCPHCGQNVGVVHCPSCGAELDVGWRFCITCGRQMSGLA